MRYSLAYQELEGTLRRWGEWQERHYFDASLPRQSSHTLIYADQPPTSKILCAEMSRSVWKINNHIINLPEKHQDALLAWYAVNVKESGGYWEPTEKAHKLGWSLNDFRIRVSRARRFLFRMAYLTSDIKHPHTESTCITAT